MVGHVISQKWILEIANIYENAFHQPATVWGADGSFYDCRVCGTASYIPGRLIECLSAGVLREGRETLMIAVVRYRQAFLINGARRGHSHGPALCIRP
jgi:hypothetical protein